MCPHLWRLCGLEWVSVLKKLKCLKGSFLRLIIWLMLLQYWDIHCSYQMCNVLENSHVDDKNTEKKQKAKPKKQHQKTKQNKKYHPLIKQNQTNHVSSTCLVLLLIFSVLYYIRLKRLVFLFFFFMGITLYFALLIHIFFLGKGYLPTLCVFYLSVSCAKILQEKGSLRWCLGLLEVDTCWR